MRMDHEASSGIRIDTLTDVVREKIRIIVCLPFVCLAVSALFLFGFEKPAYESTSVLYLLPYVSDSGEVDYNSQQANAKLVKNILSLSMQDTVLSSVARASGISDLKKLRGMLRAENETGTELIMITASSDDPSLSQLLASETASSLMYQLHQRMNLKNITVVSEAEYSESPVYTGKLRRMAYVLSAAFTADFLIVMYAYMGEHGFHSASEAEEVLQVPVLAVLPGKDDETAAKVKMRLGEMKDALLYPLPGSRMYGTAARYDLHDYLMDTDMFYTDEKVREKIRKHNRAVILVSTETDRKEIRMFIRDLELNGIDTAGIVLVKRGQEGIWN